MSLAPPKLPESVVLFASVALLGAAAVVGEHAVHTIQVLLFWLGVAGVVLSVAWYVFRSVLAHFGFWSADEKAGIDNRGGNYAGDGNTGPQTIFNSPVLGPVNINAPLRSEPPIPAAVVFGPNAKRGHIGTLVTHGFERVVHDQGENNSVDSVEAHRLSSPPVESPPTTAAPSLVHLSGQGKVTGNIRLHGNIGIGFDHLVSTGPAFQLEGDIEAKDNLVTSRWGPKEMGDDDSNSRE